MSLVISAKDLGEFAVPSACPRCLWVKLHIRRLPYQIFPGIFSSIDSYNKRVVHAYLDREGRMPGWLAPIGEVVGYVEPPSYHTFWARDEASRVTLRGTADGIFRLRAGGHAIVDYKTARYTPAQGAMLPVYTTQLNAYAYIADRVGFAPVSRLALVYMEPVTDQAAAAAPASVDGEGFNLGFSATIVPVELWPDATIPPLLERARTFYDLSEPPASSEGCRDCVALLDLFAALG